MIDRESAEHESFTAMEPALLVELEEVQKGLEETRSESLKSRRAIRMPFCVR